MAHREQLFDWVDGLPYFRGLRVETHSITVAGQAFELFALKDAADLLDHADFARRFIEKDMAPYGLELWPASKMLAEYVLTGEPGAKRSAIELGCGLGLVSQAAARMGWCVVATDHDETTLRFARYNASINRAAIVSFELLDWRDPPKGRRCDRLFAADVLYQPSDHTPLLHFVSHLLTPDGVALLADPNRSTADGFEALARRGGFDVELVHTSASDGAGRTVGGRIFRLRKGDLSLSPARHLCR